MPEGTTVLALIYSLHRRSLWWRRFRLRPPSSSAFNPINPRMLLLLSGRLLVVPTSTPALLLLSHAFVLLPLVLLSGTNNLSLLLLRLLLSSTTKSPPPRAIALTITANGENVRIHRWLCCCRLDRRQLPLLQRLGVAVCVGGTEDFLHLRACMQD